MSSFITENSKSQYSNGAKILWHFVALETWYYGNVEIHMKGTRSSSQVPFFNDWNKLETWMIFGTKQVVICKRRDGR